MAAQQGQAGPSFNRTEAQDFLALRWAAAQSERPQVHPSSSQPATPQGVKKSAWANTAKAAPTGTFAAQLVKAAGEQKTAAQTSKRECV